jgi:tetratricopeptide (TPR) repeat protein
MAERSSKVASKMRAASHAGYGFRRLPAMPRVDSIVPRAAWRRRVRRAPALLIAWAALLASSAPAFLGCTTAQRGPTVASRGASSGESRELFDATNAYNAREFGRAVSLSREAGTGAIGLSRARARYLEGLSQLQLGNADEAARALREAVEAADRTLAANARVSLGTAEIARRDFRAAADAYRRAALILDGDERRRADELAALCEARVPGMQPQQPRGPQPSAVAAFPTERAPSGSPDATRTPTERVVNGMAIEPVAFAIQAGAFSERARADRVAESLEAAASRAGLAPPRVVEKPRAGQSTVFVVQVGRFENRTVAGKAMLQFGQRGFTVERLLE